MKKVRKFKKILITGVNGSVGSYLFEFLYQKKLNVYGTYRNKKKFKYLSNFSKNHFLRLDLNNFLLTKKIIKNLKPDLIFHLASNADVRSSFDSPREIILNNNNCTLNLLEACRIYKSKALIILSSTSEVYGDAKTKVINEKNIIAPNNLYAVSKKDNICEYIIKNLRQNFYINKREINTKFNINFNEYFEKILNSLNEFKSDNLLIDDNDQIKITNSGEIYSNLIASKFDHYTNN